MARTRRNSTGEGNGSGTDGAPSVAVFRSKFGSFSVDVKTESGARANVQFAENVVKVEDVAVAAALRAHKACGGGLDFWEEDAAEIAAAVTEAAKEDPTE